MPTFSTSEVRNERWQVVMRVAGGVSTPRKYGLYCCIPAVVKRTLVSPAGTRLAGSPARCPWATKKSR